MSTLFYVLTLAGLGIAIGWLAATVNPWLGLLVIPAMIAASMLDL